MAEHQDDAELNDILTAEPLDENKRGRKRSIAVCSDAPECPEEPIEEQIRRNLVQWTSGDEKIFVPATKSVNKLTPGLYEICSSPSIGIYYEKVKMTMEGLIKFPEEKSTGVVEEICKFWEREDLFAKYGLTFKRGMILWGPPGSGKTCTIKMIIEDIIKREGIAVKFCQPSMFMQGIRMFREIEPNTPCVVLMEDIDSILDHYSETAVINILDGVDMISKVVFLATTNYPDRLGARIVNRPSRFDKRFKIGMPNDESRRIYFEHLFSAEKEIRKKINMDEWVKDTDRMSIAHLKELFTSVIIIGDEYESAVRTLSSMKDVLDGRDGRKVGFK